MNDIEFLNATKVVGGAKKTRWRSLTPKSGYISPRMDPLVAPVGPDQIAILGGFNGKCLNDGFIFDVTEKIVVKKVKSELGFSSVSNQCA